MRIYLFIAVLVVFALSSAPSLVLAGPPPVSATCNISCTVADIVEWSDDSFSAIDLGNLTAENREVSGSASLVLYTNGDVQIIADKSDATRLSKDGVHNLVTQYKLEYDAAGTGQTGGRTAGWSDYDRFLVNGSQVTHVCGDGAVEVILSVRAFKNTARAGESGRYTARQTLTVCWK